MKSAAQKPTVSLSFDSRSAQLAAEIREANLTYLMLAQHMLREERAQAMFRLGISEEVAGILESLTAAQVLKIAGQSMLMCSFRFDDEMVFRLLTNHAEAGATPSAMHASILMSGARIRQTAPAGATAAA